MLKVAIIGCGKIADAHAGEIVRIPGCEIVGVCDREELMARQLFERFPVKAMYCDVSALLDGARPDVVHITTPPQSHFSLARQCIEHGCHVYVEKPFTLDAVEAAQLVDLAQARNLKLTVGHDNQFTHVARRARELVRGGYLGGPPVHLESYYGYELGQDYARALLADKEHWVRKLPGGLLQNIISHGVARIAEYLTTETPQVMAHGFVSQRLRQRGETELVDELRAIISEPGGMTAYFTFSTLMRPTLHQLRIYGPLNSILQDNDQEVLLKLRGTHYTSYAEKFVPPLSFAKQNLGNLASNLRRFLRRNFHMTAGMKYLVEKFYESILHDTPPPISYREILLTARIMDDIFAQVREQAVRQASAPGPAEMHP